MVLGNVEETITIVDINEETLEEVIRVSLLFFDFQLSNLTSNGFTIDRQEKL